MIGSALSVADSLRATQVLAAVAAHGVRAALAGGLARAVQLGALGRLSAARPLNDIDLVVQDFDALPASLADAFVLNHVHPAAAEGQILLQLIDERLALRVDLFRAFGRSLARAVRVDGGVPVPVLAVEDLRARATAMAYGAVRRDRPIDPKHLAAVRALDGLGERPTLNEVWHEHRQGLPGSFDEAERQARRLLDERHELLVPDVYSPAVVPCDRCTVVGPLRRGDPERVVRVLGYC